MNRQEYNNCMSGKLAELKGANLPQKMKFCVGAKECSKNMRYDEALQVCNLPKEEKPAKKKRTDGLSFEQCASCLFGKIDKSTSLDQMIKILKKCKKEES